MNVAPHEPPRLPSRRGLGCLGWSLIVAGVCAVLCSGGGFLAYRLFTKALTTDAGRVRAIASQIADFTPPDDMRPAFGLDMNFGITRIQSCFYAADEGLPVVMLAQFVGKTGVADLREFEEVSGHLKNFVPRTTSEQRITIQGQEITARVQTGEWIVETAGAEPHRVPTVKAAAVFVGRGGAACVGVLVAGDDEASVARALEIIQLVR